MKKDPTEVDRMSASDHRVFCGLVLRALPHLEWRENGLGLLQAYLVEGVESELRVHIWHPWLRLPGIKTSGNIHDHRFNMVSRVLVGAVRHAWCSVERLEPPMPVVGGENIYRMCEVTHARMAMTETGNFDSEVSEFSNEFRVDKNSRTIHQGSVYRFPKFEFHESYSDTLCVTVVEKLSSEDQKARIMWPAGSRLVHAFGSEPSGNQERVLAAASDALKKAVIWGPWVGIR